MGRPAPPPPPEAVTPPWRVFCAGQVLLASFIGGALAGAYLLSRNLRRWGEPRRARTVLEVGALVTLTLIAWRLVGGRHAGLGLVSLLVAGGYHAYAIRAQGAMVSGHLARGGRRESWWRAAGVGLLGVLATGVLIGLVYLTAWAAGVELGG